MNTHSGHTNQKKIKTQQIRTKPYLRISKKSHNNEVKTLGSANTHAARRRRLCFFHSLGMDSRVARSCGVSATAVFTVFVHCCIFNALFLLFRMFVHLTLAYAYALHACLTCYYTLRREKEREFVVCWVPHTF